MEQIKETINLLFKDLMALQRRTGGLCTEELEEKIFSRKEKEHIRIVSVRKGIIRCCIDSSSWLYYFSLKKDQLLAGLTEHVPDAKDIRFSLDRQQTTKTKKSCISRKT